MESKALDKPTIKKHPLLKKHKASNMIVLFTSKNAGTVVHPDENGAFLLGDTYHNWYEEEFKPYEGIIELSN